MRTALISTTRRTDDGTPLASLQMGGRAVLQWQADLALALGCDRVACLAPKLLPEMAAVEQFVVEAGASFHPIESLLQFVGLLSADHEVVVIADGIVLDRVQLPQHLLEGRGVLALPADPGLAAGFERIDADYAWAGLIVARGSIVERLADMPPDSDIVALLLRLALQARTPVVSLGADALDDGSLLLALDTSVVAQREADLLGGSASKLSWFAPGNALAARLATSMAPGGLKIGPLIAGVLTGGLLGIGVLLSLFGYQPIGLAAIAAACLAGNVGTALNALKTRLYDLPQNPNIARYINIIIDIVIIIALTVPATLENAHERLFLPVMMVGLLRIGSNLANARIKALLDDRVVLAVILAVAAWFSVLPMAMGAMSIMCLFLALFVQSKLR